MISYEVKLVIKMHNFKYFLQNYFEALYNKKSFDNFDALIWLQYVMHY